MQHTHRAQRYWVLVAQNGSTFTAWLLTEPSHYQPHVSPSPAGRGTRASAASPGCPRATLPKGPQLVSPGPPPLKPCPAHHRPSSGLKRVGMAACDVRRGSRRMPWKKTVNGFLQLLRGSSRHLRSPIRYSTQTLTFEKFVFVSKPWIGNAMAVTILEKKRHLPLHS